MARKSRYREYLNAVRNVKAISKAPQRRTTHESILKRLKELKQAEMKIIIVQNYRYD